MNKVIIKDKEKLLNDIQMPTFDYVGDDRFCEHDLTSECAYFSGFGSCRLFDTELNAINEDDYYLRCQKCLDTFEVENEN